MCWLFRSPTQRCSLIGWAASAVRRAYRKSYSHLLSFCLLLEWSGLPSAPLWLRPNSASPLSRGYAQQDQPMLTVILDLCPIHNISNTQLVKQIVRFMCVAEADLVRWPWIFEVVRAVEPLYESHSYRSWGSGAAAADEANSRATVVAACGCDTARTDSHRDMDTGRWVLGPIAMRALTSLVGFFRTHCYLGKFSLDWGWL